MFNLRNTIIFIVLIISVYLIILQLDRDGMFRSVGKDQFPFQVKSSHEFIIENSFNKDGQPIGMGYCLVSQGSEIELYGDFLKITGVKDFDEPAFHNNCPSVIFADFNENKFKLKKALVAEDEYQNTVDNQLRIKKELNQLNLGS